MTQVPQTQEEGVSSSLLELTDGISDIERGNGAIRVANEVIAWIAALATLEVSGVHAMYSAGSPQLDKILRRSAAHRGVRVEVLGDDSLKLSVHIVLVAGTNLPQTGATVQRQIVQTIDRMLGLRIAEINVYVSEVIFI